MIDKIELIKRYQDNDNKYNKEGKLDFCLELMEYLTEDQLDEMIDKLIVITTKSQEV
jgi:hypothetical protein